MIKKISRNERRVKRHKRNMKKVRGTQDKPRLSVYRSLKNIYAQVVNDEEGKTIFAVSTVSKDFQTSKQSSSTIEDASKIGAKVAQECLKHNIKNIVFDKNGYRYHGKIKALADACREGGVSF